MVIWIGPVGLRNTKMVQGDMDWTCRPTEHRNGSEAMRWWWLFLRVRGFWENVRQFINRPHFLIFFLKVEISSFTLIPLFSQDQSTGPQPAETTVTEC